MDWVFYQMSGPSILDVSQTTISSGTSIETDLQVQYCSGVTTVNFFDSEASTIPCDVVSFTNNPDLTTINFSKTPVFDGGFYTTLDFSYNPDLTTITLSGDVGTIKKLYFRGNISYVKFWDQGLTVGERTSEYNSGQVWKI